MESRTEHIVELVFATNRLLHEQREQGGGSNACSYLHLVTLAYVKKRRPLMKEIASFLGIAPPSATSLVDTLSRTGLVAREKDRDDRRSVRIVLSTKGKKYLETYRRMAAETLRIRLARLTDKEQERLAHLLEKVMAVESSFDR